MAAGTFEYAALGYDCERNVTAEIGDAIEGGYEILFRQICYKRIGCCTGKYK